MLRHSTTLILVGGSFVLKLKRSACSDSPQWPFDTKGLPTKIAPVIPNVLNNKPLLLCGVGMRRKNFYIVEVDVYQIGISLSSAVLSNGKRWAAAGKEIPSLSDALLDNSQYFDKITNKKTQGNYKNEIKICLTLHFKRAITKSQFLDAFNEAFAGCNPISVDIFKKSLGKIVDESGVKQDEEIFFYWLDNGDFTVSRNGVIGDTFNIDEINHRLLEVYIDPKRTVSPELSQSIHKFIKEIEF